MFVHTENVRVSILKGENAMLNRLMHKDVEKHFAFGCMKERSTKPWTGLHSAVSMSLSTPNESIYIFLLEMGFLLLENEQRRLIPEKAFRRRRPHRI